MSECFTAYDTLCAISIKQLHEKSLSLAQVIRDVKYVNSMKNVNRSEKAIDVSQLQS